MSTDNVVICKDILLDNRPEILYLPFGILWKGVMVDGAKRG
jgi:hypothetical protein